MTEKTGGVSGVGPAPRRCTLWSSFRKIRVGVTTSNIAHSQIPRVTSSTKSAQQSNWYRSGAVCWISDTQHRIWSALSPFSKIPLFKPIRTTMHSLTQI